MRKHTHRDINDLFRMVSQLSTKVDDTNSDLARTQRMLSEDMQPEAIARACIRGTAILKKLGDPDVYQPATTGQAVADSTYRKRIAAAEAELAALRQARANVERTVRGVADTLVATFDAPTAITTHHVTLGDAPGFVTYDDAADTGDRESAWAEYRNDYGIGTPHIPTAAKAFRAGWDAARRGPQDGALT